MQSHRVKIWFVALYVLLFAFNKCDSYQHKQKHNHNKARSKHTIESSDDKPEGKIFGWKKQPQTNVIFITRPAILPTAPTISSTATAITSPVSIPAAATVTTLRRPYAQRLGGGGYRRSPVRRQSVRQGQVNRRQQPWNRRRVWTYGREEEEEEGESPSDVDFENNTQQSLGEYEKAEVGMGMGIREGVSAKLDIEQLEKSLLSQQDTYTDTDAGQVAVVADDLNELYKQTQREHLKVKSKRPQPTAILATAMPTSFLPATIATSNEPTYADIVVNSNGNTTKKKNKKKNSGGDKRQTIWQGIRQAWRDRREKQQKQQQELQVEIENEGTYVDRDNEIFIDENGTLHIRRRRKNNKNNKQQQLIMKNKQNKNKRRKQQDKDDEEEEDVITNKIKNSENSVISENNTNSRFQNIMNAFRRTPIIYKQHSR